MARFERLLREGGGALGLVPFYFWNGDMQDEEIRRQLTAFKEQGVSGVVLHSRMGSKLRYLSNKWFDKIRFAVDVCSSLGLKVWLYDEDNWPSGSAGGIVSGLRSDYWTQHLYALETDDPFSIPDEALAVFERSGGDFRMTEPAPELKRKARPGDRSVRYVYFNVVYGAYTDVAEASKMYVDLLNPRVVDAFLHMTHERYQRHVGFAFGDTIEAIFTDEPNYRSDDFHLRTPKIAWTTDLTESFRLRFGYDLIPVLPSLFYHWGDCMLHRYNYHLWIAERFTESYTRKVHNWCRRNGIKLAGHFLLEEHLNYAALATGNPMWHYRHTDLPGIDMLGSRPTGRNHPDLALAARMARSVALQFGKEYTVSECMGAAGWDMSYDNLRRIADWHMALGIGRLVPSAFYYTLAGVAKRDHPPSYAMQQPSWPVYHQFAGYVNRLSSVIAQGHEPEGLLVLSPIESVWCTHNPLDATEILSFPECSDWPGDPVSYWYRRIGMALLAAHVPFEFGDEGLMEEAGSVSEHGLRIGGRTYRALLVPPVHTLRLNTLRLIKQMLDRGFPVVLCGPRPSRVNGVYFEDPDAEQARLLEAVYGGASPAAKSVELNGDEDLPAFMKLLLEFTGVRPPMSVSTERGGALCAYREYAGWEGNPRLLFLANPYEDDAVVTFRRPEGRLIEWDPLDGAVYAVRPESFSESDSTVTVRLAPKESAVFIVFREDGGLAPEEPARTAGKAVKPYNWTGKPLLWNVAVMDQPEQPFVVEGEEPVRLQSLFTDMQGRFELDGEPLAVTVVRQRLGKDAAWYHQLPGYSHYKPRDAIAPGRHTLKFIPKKPGSPLEPIYLLGDFSVRLSGNTWCLKAAPEGIRLKEGSASGQGLPFYSGTILYEADLDVEEGAGAASVHWSEKLVVMELIVNGRSFPGRLWGGRPVRIPAECWKPGVNRIGLVCATTLRNTMGPFHYKPVSSIVVNAGSYRRNEQWSDEYCLLDTRFDGNVTVEFHGNRAVRIE